MKKLYCLLLISLCLATTNTRAQIDPALAADLQTILDAGISNYNLKGASAALIMPNECSWFGASGIATGPNDPADTTRQWHFASNTKSLTAAVILQLHQSGSLDINDPIGNFVDTDTIWFPHTDSTITIKQLLNHTSDITNSYVNPGPLWSAIWNDRDSVWNAWSLYDSIYGAPPTANPLDTHRYVGWNTYLLLGSIIEIVTGNSLSTEFQNRIFTPLGMDHSETGENGINMGNINGVWTGNSNRSGLDHDSYLSTRGGGGTLISKPLDVARFMRAFHNDQLVSPSLMDEAREITPGTPLPAPPTCLGNLELYYGYGTRIAKFFQPGSLDTLNFYGHTGGGLGFVLTFHNIDSNITLSVINNDFSQAAQASTFYLFADLMCQVLGNIASHSCVTGIDELTDPVTSIFPNPGNTVLNIEFQPGQQIERVELVTMEGKMVESHVYPDNRMTINTGEFSQGIYFIRVYTDKGTSVKKWAKY